MPYIKKEKRDKLVKIAELMCEFDVRADGDLNYILFKYFKMGYYDSFSYNGIKNYCGELRQCATEIERRILAPYEDQKRKENGDV